MVIPFRPFLNLFNLFLPRKMIDMFFGCVSLYKYSDSAYTEKFMGLPNVTDNYKGYAEGDLSKYVDQLKDKQFLLVSELFWVLKVTGLMVMIFRFMAPLMTTFISNKA